MSVAYKMKWASLCRALALRESTHAWYGRREKTITIKILMMDVEEAGDPTICRPAVF